MTPLFKKAYRRRMKNVSPIKKNGFSLLEVSIAMTLVAVHITALLQVIVRSQSELMHAQRLSVATIIAQTKITQLLSGRELEVTDTKGEFGQDSGIYAGYKFKLSIKEEQIDLAQVSQTGELGSKPPSVEDQLPAGVQNQQQRESLGTSDRSATGGLVDVFNINLGIDYPVGRRQEQMGEYSVQTYRHNSKGAP